MVKVASSRVRLLYSRERCPVQHCVGGRVDPSDGLDVVEKREKYLSPTGIRTPDRPSRSPVVIPNTLLRLVLMVLIKV